MQSRGAVLFPRLEGVLPEGLAFFLALDVPSDRLQPAAIVNLGKPQLQPDRAATQPQPLPLAQGLLQPASPLPGAQADLALALDAAPGFTMAHALKAYLQVCSRDPESIASARPVLTHAASLPSKPRERLHLAAIAAQRLLSPELWRRRDIGQLYLRLTWLYVDQLHLRWDPFRPTSVPSYHDEGPGYDEMMEALRRLEPMRDVWPDAPLNERLAREEKSNAVSYTHLRAHETVLDLVCRLLLETTHTLPTTNEYKSSAHTT